MTILAVLPAVHGYRLAKPLQASVQPLPPQRIVQQPAAIIPGRARQDIQIAMERMETMTRAEMVAVTSTGAALLVAIVALLASTMETPTQAPLAALEEVVGNVVDAALPLTATDVVSVSMGEGLAGLLSAGLTYGLSQLRMVTMQQMKQQFSNNNNKKTSKKTKTKSPQGTPTFSDAVADGDFLLTQAAATPFLAAVGMSSFSAAAFSLALAVVPSESIRWGARAKQRRVDEDLLLEQLLLQQQQKEQQSLFSKVQSVIKSTTQNNNIVDLDSLRPVFSDKSTKGINFVEIFCDITRWLEYSVLMNDYKGMFPLLNPAMESAVFGAMASLSALLYADVFNSYFGLSGSVVRQALEERTVAEWSSVYLTRMFYGAILFGVYEGAQGPVTFVVQDLLSGGVDSCVGSDYCKLVVQSSMEWLYCLLTRKY